MYLLVMVTFVKFPGLGDIQSSSWASIVILATILLNITLFYGMNTSNKI